MAMLVFLFILSLHATLGFETGPPVDKNAGLCKSMFPGHNVAAQTTKPSPFKFFPSQTCFTSGQEVLIQINTTKDEINGMFIQARSGTFSTAQKSHGTFRSSQKNTSPLKCFNDKDSFGHKGKIGSKSVAVVWKAPDEGLVIDIQIGGTILLKQTEFWVNEFVKLKFNKTCEQQSLGENGSSALISSFSQVLLLLMTGVVSIFLQH